MVVYRIAARVLPTKAMRALGSEEERLEESYQRWIDDVEPGSFVTTAERAAAIKEPALISVVVPTYNTPERYLRPLLQSVLDQVYGHWQLCLADGSDDAEAAARIAAAADLDPRIHYRRLEGNAGISGNTNRGLEMATGTFVALLDHDDTLSVFALAEVALAIDANPEADLIYSDEDKLSEDGSTRSLGVFKPDWSPEMLLGGNYLTHLTVVRRSLIETVGGARSAHDGAQDFDLVLRASELARQVVHIPKVLYHWRFAEGSTAVSVDSKDYAGDAGFRAVADAITRRGLDAEVWRVPERQTFYRVHYRLSADPPLVSIIIPFGERDVRRLRRCVASILRRTDYPALEIVLVAADPAGQTTRKYRKSQSERSSQIRFVDGAPGAGAAALTNAGRAESAGAFLVLMQPDVEIRSGDWVRELVALAGQDAIGAVAPLLEYAGGQVEHAGLVLGLAGVAGHPWRWRNRKSFTFFGSAEWPRNFLAVSSACLCVRTDRFDAAGGLVEHEYADAILGLRLHDLGLRNVYWPYVVLRHDERRQHERPGGAARPDTSGHDQRLQYYAGAADPYFNPNLDPSCERIGLRPRA